MNFLSFIIGLLLNLVILLSFSWVIYKIGAHLYRKFFLHKTQKQKKLSPQEKRKIWFYNLWLPSFIYIVFYVVVSSLLGENYRPSIRFDVCTIIEVFFRETINFKVIEINWFFFYLIYHFIYSVIRFFSSQNHFDKKLFIKACIFNVIFMLLVILLNNFVHFLYVYNHYCSSSYIM